MMTDLGWSHVGLGECGGGVGGCGSFILVVEFRCILQEVCYGDSVLEFGCQLLLYGAPRVMHGLT